MLHRPGRTRYVTTGASSWGPQRGAAMSSAHANSDDDLEKGPQALAEQP
jgi:hypothetical protein